MKLSHEEIIALELFMKNVSNYGLSLAIENYLPSEQHYPRFSKLKELDLNAADQWIFDLIRENNIILD